MCLSLQGPIGSCSVTGAGQAEAIGQASSALALMGAEPGRAGWCACG